MRKFRCLMPVLFLGIFALMSAILMWIWNWLMPGIFGLVTINFWQALCLIIMAKILFGGISFGLRHHGMNGFRRNHRNFEHGNIQMQPGFEGWSREFSKGPFGFGFGRPGFGGMVDFNGDLNEEILRKKMKDKFWQNLSPERKEEIKKRMEALNKFWADIEKETEPDPNKETTKDEE